MINEEITRRPMGLVSSNLVKWLGIFLIVLAFMPIFNSTGFHCKTPGTQRIPIASKSFWIDHLFPYNDGYNSKHLVYVVVDFIGVIPSVQNDISELIVRISVNHLIY